MTESTVSTIERPEPTASANATVSLKKPYERPWLRAYGDVATITETVGMGRRFDGRRNKTH